MLEITMSNGMSDKWYDDEYTTYEYQGDIFVIIDGDQWVGIYNMRDVSKIVYYDKSKEN